MTSQLPNHFSAAKLPAALPGNARTIRAIKRPKRIKNKRTKATDEKKPLRVRAQISGFLTSLYLTSKQNRTQDSGAILAPLLDGFNI